MRFSVKEDGAAVAFLLALVAWYFIPVLIAGNRLVLSARETDTWDQFFYWRHFGFSSLARGEIPLWNPYIFSGVPYIAGIQSAIFYPLNLLYLLFGTPFAINLSIALHCFLAGLFTYLFARYMDLGRDGSVLSAITFTYGAPYFLHIYPGHLSNLSTMVWLPLMFMGVEAFLRNNRLRYAVLSGIPLSMQALAGHAQYLFYSAIAVSLYFLLRLLVEKELRRIPYFLAGFCLFVMTGLSLSAIQLIPTLELTSHSMRHALSYEWVSTFSFPPENLITLLVPDFFGSMLSVPYWGKNYLWEMSVYLGVVPLVMIAGAILLDRSKPVLIFAALAAISLVLALGKHTPLLWLLYSYAPGFDLFRGLSKFVYVFSFACSMLAGYGLSKLTALAEESDPRLRLLSYSLLAISFFVFLFGIPVLLYGQEYWISLVEGYAKGADNYSPVVLTDDFLRATIVVAFRGLFGTAVIMLLLGGLWFIFGGLRRLSPRLLAISVLTLSVLDLWGFGSRYLVTFSPTDIYMDREVKAFLKADKEPFRIGTPLPDLLNVSMLEGIENIGGSDALILARYNEFMNFAQALPIDAPSTIMYLRGITDPLNLLNVKYYIVEATKSIGLPTVELVFQNQRYKVYRNKDVLPRSFVVHDVRIIERRDEIFRQIAGPEFAPRSYAIVEEKIDALPRHSTVQSPLPKVVARSLNRVVIDADAKQPGLLVLGDSYYPGWKAFVDGQESKIYRTNHVMRGVIVPAGQHRVEFRYQPLSFRIGVLISLVSLVLVVAFLIRLRIRSWREWRSPGKR